jgi:ribonuclease J
MTANYCIEDKREGKNMKYLDHNVTDWGKIKSDIKDSLSDFIWRRTQRRPMILPIIMEADT